MGEPLIYPVPTNEARLEMRVEPQSEPVMHQTWSRLLFLHWEWDPREIQEKLPPGLFVDTHNGRAYVGIIPFFVSDTKPFVPFIPAPGDFLEVNVRTYVYDELGRPGVWFFSLDCTSAFAANAAKFFYSLPYHTAAIEAEINGDFVEYRARRNADAQNRLSEFHYKPEPEQIATPPGSLSFFLIERYLLFAWSEKSQSLTSARVYHQPYQAQKVLVGKWGSHFLDLNGFKPSLKDPVHTAFAQPVRVKIYGPEPVPQRPVRGS